jgi:hypothetical protein
VEVCIGGTGGEAAAVRACSRPRAVRKQQASVRASRPARSLAEGAGEKAPQAPPTTGGGISSSGWVAESAAMHLFEASELSRTHVQRA